MVYITYIRKRGNNMNEKLYYSTVSIAAMFGSSMVKSYNILWEMNGELVSIGFLTISELATQCVANYVTMKLSTNRCAWVQFWYTILKIT